jgi:hypothetical protein
MRQQALHWAKAPAGNLFVLSLGTDDGTIRIVREDENWLVVRKLGPNENWKETVVASSNDLADATDLAEASIDDDIKHSVLLDPNHVWRHRLAESISEKQARLVDKFKIRYVPGRTTKGELSDAIGLAMARLDEDYRTGRRQPRYVPIWVR